MTYLTLLAKVTAKVGRDEELFGELKEMVAPSRAEAGCLKYVLHRVWGDERGFWFVEEWRDQGALDEHNGTAHYLRMKERTKEMVEGVELVFLEAVE